MYYLQKTAIIFADYYKVLVKFRKLQQNHFMNYEYLTESKAITET